VPGQYVERGGDIPQLVVLDEPETVVIESAQFHPKSPARMSFPRRRESRIL
jgi:hypothetical protein